MRLRGRMVQDGAGNWRQIPTRREQRRRRARARGMTERRPSSPHIRGYNGGASYELRCAYVDSVVYGDGQLGLVDSISFFNIDTEELDRAIAYRNEARQTRSTRWRRRLHELSEALLRRWEEREPHEDRAEVEQKRWEELCEVRVKHPGDRAAEDAHRAMYLVPKTARERHHRRVYRQIFGVRWERPYEPPEPGVRAGQRVRSIVTGWVGTVTGLLEVYRGTPYAFWSVTVELDPEYHEAAMTCGCGQRHFSDSGKAPTLGTSPDDLRLLD